MICQKLKDIFFKQENGGRQTLKRENLHNLVDGYYDQLLGGKNADWIKCYAQGQYTYVQEGKPVWSEYDDTLMAEDLEITPNLPVIVGLDFGLSSLQQLSPKDCRTADGMCCTS